MLWLNFPSVPITVPCILLRYKMTQKIFILLWKRYFSAFAPETRLFHLLELLSISAVTSTLEAVAEGISFTDGCMKQIRLSDERLQSSSVESALESNILINVRLSCWSESTVMSLGAQITGLNLGPVIICCQIFLSVTWNKSVISVNLCALFTSSIYLAYDNITL